VIDMLNDIDQKDSDGSALVNSDSQSILTVGSMIDMLNGIDQKDVGGSALMNSVSQSIPTTESVVILVLAFGIVVSLANTTSITLMHNFDKGHYIEVGAQLRVITADLCDR
jgi:hypothetical protein